MSIAIVIAMGLLPIGGADSAAAVREAEDVLVSEISQTPNSDEPMQYAPAFSTGDGDSTAVGEPAADVVGAGTLAKVACIGCTAGILLVSGSSLFGLAVLLLSPVAISVPACVLGCKQAFY